MASQPIYQYHAELQDYEPKIWRRFQVAGNMTMARLGYVVMTLFEMQASHLFCFDVPFAENFDREMKKRLPESEWMKYFRETDDMREKTKNRLIEIPDEDSEDFQNEDRLDATEIKVGNVLRYPDDWMTFSYDYGDGWQIHMTLEEIITDKELPGRELPRVLEGDGYGIVEDCGGTNGLAEIAQAYKKKKGARYREYCEWLGTDALDLSAFDIGDMNFRLKKVPRIYSDIYEYGLEPTRQSIHLLERRYLKK